MKKKLIAIKFNYLFPTLTPTHFSSSSSSQIPCNLAIVISLGDFKLKNQHTHTYTREDVLSDWKLKSPDELMLKQI